MSIICKLKIEIGGIDNLKKITKERVRKHLKSIIDKEFGGRSVRFALSYGIPISTISKAMDDKYGDISPAVLDALGYEYGDRSIFKKR